jgi:hypothetical protein
MVSLLCHDIGYVRGVCRGDLKARYVCNAKGDLVTVPSRSTDAFMIPYHVTRSKLFVRERFGKDQFSHIDPLAIEANIEYTRFPIPEDEEHTTTDDYPCLVGAADLMASSPMLTTCERCRRCSRNSPRPELAKNSGTGRRPICAPAIQAFSGKWSNLTSAMPFTTCG